VRAEEKGWQGLKNGAPLDAAEQAGSTSSLQTGQIVEVDVATL